MRQAFAWWSFSYGRETSGAEALLRAAADIGYAGVEMLPESLWGAAADAGLEVVTLTGHDLNVGFNDPANHSAVSRAATEVVDCAASARVPYVIVFSGRRGAASDAAAARQYFQRQGVATEETTPIPGADRFFIRDPDGNRIEIIQWLRPYNSEENARA